MPRLLIIMREDLWDMNPGKGMAQAAHAAQDMTATIMSTGTPYEKEQYEQWCEGRNFGVTITLSAPFDSMSKMSLMLEMNGVPNGMTVDPTYPYRNYYGDVFTSSEVTCMWVFIHDEVAEQVQAELKQHTKLHV
jgi:peptidyl-tRNA hydrolase